MADCAVDSAAGIGLRRTSIADLDFVLALEHHPDQVSFIGQWTRDEHVATLERADREHLIIEADGVPLGYLIGYDVRAAGYGLYIKRIAIAEKSRGIGRAASPVPHSVRTSSMSGAATAPRTSGWPYAITTRARCGPTRRSGSRASTCHPQNSTGFWRLSIGRSIGA